MWKQFVRPSIAWTCLLLCVAIPTLSRADELGEVFRKMHNHFFEQKKPHTDKAHPVETYAKQIDWLEHRIDIFGSVVPKTPDIWGQARLTQHRQQYEQQMSKQLDQFTNTLQGSIRRSDQSFLALAFSLNAAAGGAEVPTGNDAQTMILNQGASDPIQRGSGLVTDSTDPFAHFKTKELSLEPAVELAQRSRYLNYLNELRRINEGDDTSDSPGYALYLARLPVSVLPGKHTESGYGAEITFTIEPQLTEELLPSTFRNLVTNDVADQLSLVVTKVLQDEELVDDIRVTIGVMNAINWDVMENICSDPKFNPQAVRANVEWMLKAHYAANRFTNPDNKPWIDKRETIIKDIIQEARRIHELNANVPDALSTATPPSSNSAQPSLKSFKKIRDGINYSNFAMRSVTQRTQLHLQGIQNQSLSSLTMTRSRNRALPFPPSQNKDVFGDFHVLAHVILSVDEQLRKDPVNQNLHVHLPDVRAILSDELAAAYDFLSLPETLNLWHHCGAKLANAIRGRKRFLQLEPDYYKPKSQPWLGQDIQGAPIQPIDGDHEPAIAAIRTDFFNHILWRYTRAKHTATASLAWAILCESALLNQALIDDMSRVATEKGCACQGAEQFPYFLPKPLPLTPDVMQNPDIVRIHADHVAALQAASRAFIEYVRCRWPVIVFALDPVTDDQNIADAFSRRREMQLAVAVAVANGNVRPSAAGRFVRRLETDIETIALNRTAVAFSHGNDTFGWRFYPRVQTPPFRSNARTFAETLVGPHPDQDLRARKLEPGMREGYAIVLMPSFVPYASFSSRSNWFGLSNPAKKELSLDDAMQLSRTFQHLQQFSQYVQHCGQYRPQDVSHLTRVVDQLSRRMPFHDSLVQIPYENTVGGFELFATGVTDLGPELQGFYGAPGILLKTTNPADNIVSVNPEIIPSTLPAPITKPDGTTLFLVGNHFSVTNTHVIAGGRYVPFRLLSRQIMEVLIPPNVSTLIRKLPDDSDETVVDVHVATPYGVTNHLLIPAINLPDPATEALEKRIDVLERPYSVDPAEVVLTFQYLEASGSKEKEGMLDPASIEPAGDASLDITYTAATRVNQSLKSPKHARVVLLPRSGGDVELATGAGVSGKLPFDDKTHSKIGVDKDSLRTIVQSLISSQNDPPILNRNVNGNLKEIKIHTQVFLSLDDDSQPYAASQLVVKLRERIISCPRVTPEVLPMSPAVPVSPAQPIVPR